MPAFGATYKYTSTDTAAAIDTTKLASNSRGAISALITVEDADIRIAFGGTAPTQAGVGHLVTAGESFVTPEGVSVRSLQIISAVNGSAAEVQITPIFE